MILFKNFGNTFLEVLFDEEKWSFNLSLTTLMCINKTMPKIVKIFYFYKMQCNGKFLGVTKFY